MLHQDLGNIFVLLCDWRGHVVWSSTPNLSISGGDLAWQNLAPDSQRQAQETLARVAMLRQPQTLAVVNQEGMHFRCWLWPLDAPETAVCALCREVPSTLDELSDRELECLQLLAQGLPTKTIAEQLDLSTSTLHTHLSRARTKLNLDNLEALISFAARYCYPVSLPLHPESRD
jgi:DNA-binding CsgD family transcriptional regulator